MPLSSSRLETLVIRRSILTLDHYKHLRSLYSSCVNLQHLELCGIFKIKGSKPEIPAEFMEGLIFLSKVLGSTLLSLNVSNNFLGAVYIEKLIDEVLVNLPKL